MMFYEGKKSMSIAGRTHRRTEHYIIYLNTFFLFTSYCNFFFQVQPTNSMGSELTSDNSRSCMDTPMNMYSSKVEGAHQEINRSLLPCRHTDNEKCIGILGMHPCFY